MNWINFFDEIFVINLLKRSDRLLQITQDFERYGIPFTRVSAIEDREQGARGLRDTMLNLYKDALSKGYRNILVFEDDCKMIEEPDLFHIIMNNVVKQLPDNYHFCYLGGQMSSRPSHFHSANLIPVVKYFATHAVCYSEQGMKEVLSREMGYPIDNWATENIQVLGHCYCVHPLLCSQHPGISDIGGGQYIDWHPFIVPRHQQKISEMNIGK